jgi:Secretion system C-terminal sorting domain
MKTESTFTSRGWDFSSIWAISSGTNNGYPYLQGVTPLLVELVTFTASVVNSNVELKWTTSTEVSSYGFDIERKPETVGGSTQSGWLKIGFVKGSGNSNSPKSYSFVDASPDLSGNAEYRLKQINNDGSFTYSNAIDISSLPTQFALFQNYPNPFNPTTEISYQLPEDSHVTLKVYDELGKEVATLVNEQQKAGEYSVQLSADSYHLASGVYIYRLQAVPSGRQAGNFNSVRKMVLLK